MTKTCNCSKWKLFKRLDAEEFEVNLNLAIRALLTYTETLEDTHTHDFLNPFLRCDNY